MEKQKLFDADYALTAIGKKQRSLITIIELLIEELNEELKENKKKFDRALDEAVVSAKEATNALSRLFYQNIKCKKCGQSAKDAEEAEFIMDTGMCYVCDTLYTEQLEAE